jgi:hypothetical protein
MACYQNPTLDTFSSHSALSVLVNVLFKKFGLFLNTPVNEFCLFADHTKTQRDV